MRRLIAPVALIAVLALAGCSGSEAKTTADACDTVTSSWDEFESFAQTPGRDDAEMVDMRGDMVDTWEASIADAPEWTTTAVGAAADYMREFENGSGSKDQTNLYSLTASQIDLLREQCTEDGNL